jgi:hypothetical protein
MLQVDEGSKEKVRIKGAIMAWGPGETPKFIREPRTLEQLKSDIRITNPIVIFEFLDKLDWNKTAIFWEKDRRSHSGCEGYRIVHFINEVEEKWHNVWGHTWIGLSAWMS